MSKNNSVTGLENFRGILTRHSERCTIDCISCGMGKQARLTFPPSTRFRAMQIGQRVHVDICGPIGQATLGGKRYIVVFKDEYSAYRHVYLIASKDEVLDTIRKTVAIIKSNTQKTVVKLVSDNGSVVTSNRTRTFLLNSGIIQEHSAPFTPEQNGFVERENRTISEAVRTALIHF